MAATPSRIMARKFNIFVENLPLKTTWRELKDFVHNAGGQEPLIDVDYAEVYAEGCFGNIRVVGDANYTRVWNFLLGREWKGYVLKPLDERFVSTTRPYYLNTLPLYSTSEQALGVIHNASHGSAVMVPKPFSTIQMPQHAVTYASSVTTQTTDYNYTTSNLGTTNINGVVVIRTEARGVHINMLPSGITEPGVRILVQNCLKKPNHTNHDAVENVELRTRPGETRKGYALVTLRTHEIACDVVEALNNTYYDNMHLLKVKLDHDFKATPQPASCPLILKLEHTSTLSIRHQRNDSLSSYAPPTQTPSFRSTTAGTYDDSPSVNSEFSAYPLPSDFCDPETLSETTSGYLSSPEPISPAVVDGTKNRSARVEAVRNIVEKRAVQPVKDSGHKPKPSQECPGKDSGGSHTGKRTDKGSKGHKKNHRRKQ